MTTITILPIDTSSTSIVSTLTTVTSVATISSTITSSLTTTSTTILPQATFYAACSPNNLVSRINGVSLTHRVPVYNFGQTARAPRAYDCCLFCLETASCGAAAYDNLTGNCYFNNNNCTCSPTEQDVKIVGGSGQFTFANSNCGQAFYNGK